MPTQYLLYGVPHWNKLVTLTFVQGLGLIKLDKKPKKQKPKCQPKLFILVVPDQEVHIIMCNSETEDKKKVVNWLLFSH